MPDNYQFALDRFFKVEAGKHYRCAETKKAFIDVVEKWQTKGYTETIPKPENGWYLPIFPVVRWDKQTSKVRPVVDGKARYKGVSLNDFMYRGPDYINDLVVVLTRFRLKQVALVGDVAEMFLQVQVPEEQRNLHCFVWRNAEGELEVRRFVVHPFGNRASPAVAMWLVRHQANLMKEEFPEAYEVINHHTIVDDNMTSVDSVEDALRLKDALIKIYGDAGMTIHKWLSNSTEVMEAIPQELRGKGMEIEDADLKTDLLPCTKALGVIWSTSADAFFFKMDEIDCNNKKWTKRLMSSFAARIFDPCGFLAPLLIIPKCILRKAWLEKLDWDDPLPKSIEKEWTQWTASLSDVSQAKIPRALTRGAFDKMELHLFH